MGLHIQTLNSVPISINLSYYIYLLDYGWSESLSEAMIKNYEKIAAIAENNDAVVLRGLKSVHFQDEVLSWHNINGQNADDILPAILVTNKNPHHFKDGGNSETNHSDYKLVLIPLKDFCTTTTEVVDLIKEILNDIIAKKPLDKFQIQKIIRKGSNKAIVDSLILGPNTQKIGIDTAKIIDFVISTNDKLPLSKEDLLKHLSILYPLGPEENDIWIRAGGDLSILGNTSRKQQWRTALTQLWNGGGGKAVTIFTLLTAISEDLPNNSYINLKIDELNRSYGNGQ